MVATRPLLSRFVLIAAVVGMVSCSPARGELETVEDWFAAYEEGDIDRYQSLMSPETTYDCLACGYDRATAVYFAPAGGAEQDVRDSRLFAIAKGTFDPSCTSDGDLVTCTTERISMFGYSDAAGQPSQVDRSTYDFVFANGQITHLTVTRTAGNLFDFNKIKDYRQWVEEHHSESYDDLFFLSTILIDDDDTFAQHQELADEYLNSPP